MISWSVFFSSLICIFEQLQIKERFILQKKGIQSSSNTQTHKQQTDREGASLNTQFYAVTVRKTQLTDCRGDRASPIPMVSDAIWETESNHTRLIRKASRGGFSSESFSSVLSLHQSSYLQAGELLLLHQSLLHQHALDALLHCILFCLHAGNSWSQLCSIQRLNILPGVSECSAVVKFCLYISTS